MKYLYCVRLILMPNWEGVYSAIKGKAIGVKDPKMVKINKLYSTNDANVYYYIDTNLALHNVLLCKTGVGNEVLVRESIEYNSGKGYCNMCYNGVLCPTVSSFKSLSRVREKLVISGDAVNFACLIHSKGDCVVDEEGFFNLESFSFNRYFGDLYPNILKELYRYTGVSDIVLTDPLHINDCIRVGETDFFMSFNSFSTFAKKESTFSIMLYSPEGIKSFNGDYLFSKIRRTELSVIQGSKLDPPDSHETSPLIGGFTSNENCIKALEACASGQARVDDFMLRTELKVGVVGNILSIVDLEKVLNVEITIPSPDNRFICDNIIMFLIEKKANPKVSWYIHGSLDRKNPLVMRCVKDACNLPIIKKIVC